MSKIETAFAIPIFKYQIKNWEEKQKKLLTLHKKRSETYVIAEEKDDHVLSDYHSLYDHDYWEEVALHLEEELEDFANTVEMHLQTNGYWFESAKKGMHHGVHNHGAIGYSAVLYIQFDEEQHKAVTFVSPFNNFINGEPSYYYPEAKSGTLLFFPSSILHYTDPNTSDLERIVFSFNLIPKH